MPDDRETWHLVLSGLDEVARSRHGAGSFAALPLDQREAVVGDLVGGRFDCEAGRRLNPGRAWAVCMRMILAAFYSHPFAWNEIGFGGPAYPRGYMRLGPTSTLEPFERPGATDEDPVEAVEDGSPS
ncbi:MAG: gluconate 2-dehydrogenase subunit 3 family protein, partial [Acidimicrobiales bacterium]